MSFMPHRPRRLRTSEKVRALVSENRLSVNDLVMPFFVVPGKGIRTEIASMPGNFHLSVDMLAEETARVRDVGVPAVLLFGVPEKKEKDPLGSSAYSQDALVPSAIRQLKKKVPGILVAADVCLCAYTDHGHCGVVKKTDFGEEIDNDSSVELIARMALAHARAGADIVAPSDMMDGRVGAIRESLENEGYHNTVIMSYAAKYASAFYGPFRDAAESPPSFGDRSTYQMDPANSEEAMREIAADLEEGADIVMVKPALSYLDVIQRVKSSFGVPVAAYSVSGEFSMVKAAANAGLLDERETAMEMTLSMKRAGADIIITYWATELSKWLGGGS